MHTETENSAKYDKKHRVIATNMPFNVADQQILKHFRGAVSIERHRKGGVATGAVFIQCENAVDVSRFIKTLDKSRLCGREIRVAQLHDREVFKARQKTGALDEEENENENESGKRSEDDENARGRKRRLEFDSMQKRRMPDGEEERTLFITNISFKDTEEQLVEVFSEHGEIEQCTLVQNKETGVPTGRAFVLYKNKESCKAALKQPISLNGRSLVVLKYISPEILKQKEAQQKEKDYQREKTIKDRKEGKLEPRDPSKLSTCRVHISHMDKKHTRKSISKVIEEHFLEKHEKKLKLRGVNLTANSSKRNPGYCFVTFKFPEDAETFIQEQNRMRRKIGPRMVAEYAMESKEFLEKGIKKKPSKIERVEKRNKKLMREKKPEASQEE
ncbi:uncharacterized protein NEMAJ01_0434 [Nematocida major]|uniref:uncharacterized protein n=1 Tax=Nematocida major TaxID=1912982 RepID=UPI002007CAC1|nr:uncharacterized protein NEMAJ01_0434 [Nematocida major]KAH9385538.1 hypothetical protein NEMAJ01_0434 [Nematocida major]